MGTRDARGVSVVIPACNAAAFLPDALESVFQQTHQPLEVIVVDDGSTDATPTVVDRFRNRVVYLRKENGGPSSARNRGISHARGDWIAFLDADDMWMPQRLERQWALAQKKDADFVFSDAAVFPTNGVASFLSTSSWLSSVKRRALIEAGVIDGILPDPFRFFIEHGCFVLISTVLVRTKSLLDAGLFDETLRACEDWDLLFRLSFGCRMAFSPESLVIRRLHGGNLSMNYHTMYREELKMWEKTGEIETVKKQDKWRKIVRRAKASGHLGLGVLSIESNRPAEARAHWANSLALRPSFRPAAHWAVSLLPASWGNALRRTVRRVRRALGGRVDLEAIPIELQSVPIDGAKSLAASGAKK